MEKNVLLKYKQRLYNIDYKQEETVILSKVSDRIKELKSFSNRKYHTFRIN
jgi:hypothetical protein